MQNRVAMGGMGVNTEVHTTQVNHTPRDGLAAIKPSESPSSIIHGHSCVNSDQSPLIPLCSVFYHLPNESHSDMLAPSWLMKSGVLLKLLILHTTRTAGNSCQLGNNHKQGDSANKCSEGGQFGSFDRG